MKQDTEKIVQEIAEEFALKVYWRTCSTCGDVDRSGLKLNYAAAIRSALSRSEQKWIEVSDRQKPKDKEQVFVLLPNLTIGGRFTGWRGYLAEYNYEYDDFDSASGMVEFESGDIKFWKSMPLPEPPSEGGK